jgi:hypothetical protein
MDSLGGYKRWRNRGFFGERVGWYPFLQGKPENIEIFVNLGHFG